MNNNTFIDSTGDIVGPVSSEEIQKVIDGLKLIKQGATSMSTVYDNAELNNIQPQSFREVLPMSLDEWAIALTKAIKDWEDLLGRTKQD